MRILQFHELTQQEQKALIREGGALAYEKWNGYKVTSDWENLLRKNYGFLVPEVQFEFKPGTVQVEISCQGIDVRNLLTAVGLPHFTGSVVALSLDNGVFTLRQSLECNLTEAVTILILAVLDSFLLRIKGEIATDLKEDLRHSMSEDTVSKSFSTQRFLRESDILAEFGHDVVIVR